MSLDGYSVLGLVGDWRNEVGEGGVPRGLPFYHHGDLCLVKYNCRVNFVFQNAIYYNLRLLYSVSGLAGEC